MLKGPGREGVGPETRAGAFGQMRSRTLSPRLLLHPLGQWAWPIFLLEDRDLSFLGDHAEPSAEADSLQAGTYPPQDLLPPSFLSVRPNPRVKFHHNRNLRK